MARAAATRLSVAAGRRFAATLALGFGVLALVFLWRERTLLSRVAMAMAGVLALAGLVLPRHLGSVERLWTRFGMALGRITAPIFLGVVYWLVITPFGVLRRTLGRSPITHRGNGGSFWVVRPKDRRDPRERMTRQF